MLSYNIFIFLISFLLYMDYLSHLHTVKVKFGESEIYVGNSFLYLALFVIIFFAGFRFEIGYDYPKYLAGYLYDSELREWEPLFVSLVKILRHINFGLDTQIVFLFFSFMTVMIIYFALKKLTSHFRMGLLLYLLIPSMYLNSFSVIRQAIALVVLFYGLQYIVAKKTNYKKYFITVVLAFLLHSSSIFVAFVYIIGTKFFERSYSLITYFFLITISFFLSFAHMGKVLLFYAPGHFSSYLDNGGTSVNFFKLLIVNIFFIFLLFQKNNFCKNKFDYYLLNSMFIGVMIFNVFGDFVFVSRLAQYFLIAEIVLVPLYLYSIKNTMLKKIMLVLFLLYYLFNYNYALYRDETNNIRNNPYALVPYKNYFLEKKEPYRRQILRAWYDFILENDSKVETNDKL